MKLKLFVLLLAAAVIMGLTACGDGAAQSVQDMVPGIGAEDEPEEDETYEVPEVVKELSEEDEILLNGELKDGVYINRYFGYKFTAPEGKSLERLNDGATESKEILSFAEIYEKDEGGLFISTDIEDLDVLFVSIRALDEDEIGLSEEELVRKNIEDIWELNKLFEEEGGPEYDTEFLAGEEHPIAITREEAEGKPRVTVNFYLPKDNFVYDIYISVDESAYKDTLKCFEKLD